MENSCDAIVIGAGPAGLAAAAALKARGRDTVILEKSGVVGSVWRRHYDRLHLHTDRARSGLPGLPMPKAYGRYPSRVQVVEYLENYAAKFDLKPVFNVAVGAIRRDRAAWRAEAGRHSWRAPNVVIATGWADFPHSPVWPGIETFAGPVQHSSVYRNPTPFAGKRVLVIGYGNSGAEIALDLAETGIDVTLSVRSPVNIVPRELFGLPILVFPIAEQWLPPRAADILNALPIRFAVGSLATAGLTKAAKGPLRTIAEDGRPPLIDVGTLAQIRAGRIKVRGDVAHFTVDGVAFAHSPTERFDAAIIATGFRPDLHPLLPDAKGVLTASGAPLVSGRETAELGLFFCGALVSPIGQLRQIAIEAVAIADAIVRAPEARDA
ncbi:MAG TPA: NAD(P)/FAD-dependent oxidoreductase [Roseiarcus sp.]|jgi:cation diffusion facilitator CzcD-associated flavoprotein CzcO